MNLVLLRSTTQLLLWMVLVPLFPHSLPHMARSRIRPPASDVFLALFILRARAHVHHG